MAAVCLPIQWPPTTDLAQHAAQTRLLQEALTDADGPWRIQWLTPYWTACLGLSALAAAVPADWLPRLAVLTLLLAWLGAMYLLVRRRRRGPELMLLALPLLFNRVLLWGFWPFAFGFVAFVLWLLVVVAIPPHRQGDDLPLQARHAALLVAGGLLLWFSHALWWAAAVVFLLLHGLAVRRSLRQGALISACLLPTVALALWWYPQLQALGFDTPAVWARSLGDRLGPVGLADTILGGLRGPVEAAWCALAAGWCLSGLWTRRKELADAADPVLAITGAALLIAAVVLPDKYENTVEFARRWAPFGALLLVLGAPVPRWPRRWRVVVAAVAAGLVLPVTAAAWMAFDRQEMAGFSRAVDALPPAPRLLSLDFIRFSSDFTHQPTMQMGAWAQQRHGGQLSFSFAEMAPMPVIMRQMTRPPWTQGLEWYPQRLRRSDLKWFDHALVRAPPRVHAALTGDGRLKPLHKDGTWRSYRIAPLAAPATEADDAG